MSEKITADPMTDERKAELANLAQEHMGTKFTGEVPVVEETEEVIEEVATEESEEVEETVEDAAEETEEVEEEVAAQSFDEIREQLGLDEEGAKNIKLTRKINGQESEITVGDLLETNQTLEAARAELEGAKAKSAAILEDANKRQDAVKEEFGVAARLIEDIEKQLDLAEGAADLEKLKQDDPAAYSVKRLEFDDRRREIEGMKAKAREDYKKAQGEVTEQNKEKFNEFVKTQQAAIMNAIPEWKDEKVGIKEASSVQEYLLSHPSGFSPVEMENAYDHRFWVFGRKAMLYDQIKAEAGKKKKKIATVPKTMKPGAAKSPGQRQTLALKNAKAKLAKTGTPTSALEVLQARRAAQKV